MHHPSPVTVTLDGTKHPVTFTGLFNGAEAQLIERGGKTKQKGGVRQQETDPIGVGRNKDIYYSNGPAQAAHFNQLGQQLADLVSDVYAQDKLAVAANMDRLPPDPLRAPHASSMLRILHLKSREIVSSGQANSAPAEAFVRSMEAIDPRFGPIIAQYMDGFARAYDIRTPRLFQEDLGDIVRALDVEKKLPPRDAHGRDALLLPANVRQLLTGQSGPAI